MEQSYISGNGAFLVLYFSYMPASNFPCSKNEKTKQKHFRKLELSSSNLKRHLFCRRIHQGFSSLLPQVLLFHDCFLLLMFRCFHGAQHLFVSLFHHRFAIIVLDVFIVFHQGFFTIVFWCFHCFSPGIFYYCFWVFSLFFTRDFLLLFLGVFIVDYSCSFRKLSLRCIVVPCVLRISESFFLLSGAVTLRSSPTFDLTCFYQGLSGSRQFFLEGCRVSH